MTTGPLAAAVPTDDPDGTRGTGEYAGSTPRAAPDPPARPQVSDDDDRDDARQVLTVLLAALQRERARADQFYTRGRNLLAYASAIFVAVQAAFLANVGREVGGERLVTSGQVGTIAWFAVAALVLLLVTAALVFGWADRARPVNTTGGDDLLKQWLDPDGHNAKLPVLHMLVAKVADEEESWASANKTRDILNRWVAASAGVATVATLAELVALYFAVK